MINRQKLIEEIDDKVAGLTNMQIMQIADIIESQPPADQWIPCSEPPKATDNYLVTSKGCTWVAYWFNQTWWGIEKRCRWTDVEAWMPLPEPFKGE